MGIVFKNNAKTTLASNLSNSATSATVTDGSVFPTLGAGEFFLITFDDGTNNEICKCTARSSNTLTIVRAQDNTSARAFSSGDAAEGRVTAGVLETIQENIAAKSANQTVYNATTASSATAYNIGIDPGVEANAMVFLDGVMQHHDTFSFSGSTLTFDAAPVDGTKLEVIVDNLINLQSSNLTVDTFTAADVGGSAQTDFTLSDTPAAETNLIVFVEGVFQDQDAYTISSNTLTITTGVIAGRGVTVYVINPVNIGTPSDGTITSAKLSGNLTLPGTLTVGANDVAFDSPTFVVDNSNSRVGLGTASPTVPVDIVGDVKMSANLTVDTTTLVVDSTNNKVGIGTASPGNVLHVHQSDATSNAYVHITQEDGGSAATDGLSIGIEDGGVNAVIRNRENGYLRMYTNNTERTRIQANGRTAWSANGIGDVTTVPRDFAFYTEGSTNGVEVRSNDERLVFIGAGGSSGTGSDNGYLAMSSQGTGTMALNANGDSYLNGGKVGIGLTSPAHSLQIENSGGSYWALFIDCVSSDYGAYARGSGNYAWAVLNSSTGTYRGRWDFSGVLYTSDGNVHDIDSDERLKEEITDCPSQWSLIKDLPLQRFKWKDRRNGESYSYGWVAQDTKTKYPEFVEKIPQTLEDIDEGKEDEEYLTVRSGDIQRRSIAALQEAMARIEVLEAEVAALKG